MLPAWHPQASVQRCFSRAEAVGSRTGSPLHAAELPAPHVLLGGVQLGEQQQPQQAGAALGCWHLPTAVILGATAWRHRSRSLLAASPSPLLLQRIDSLERVR